MGTNKHYARYQRSRLAAQQNRQPARMNPFAEPPDVREVQIMRYVRLLRAIVISGTCVLIAALVIAVLA